MTLIWKIEFDEAAKKDMAKLDKQVSKRIIRFLRERIAVSDDPRNIGQALKGSKLGNFWRYRVGDYRIVCDIQDGSLRILVVKVGNRGNVYR